MVAGGGIAADEFAEESCEEKHDAQDEEEHGEVEPDAGGEGDASGEAEDDNDNQGDEAEEAGEASHGTEEVHGLFAEFGHEHDGHEVEVAVDEAVHAKFGDAELTFAVLDDFLADVGEASPFGDDGDVAVHLAVDFDGFDDVAAIGFETAVEVVEFDAAEHARGAVEELGRDVFGKFGVVAFLLPTGDEVESVFLDHAEEFGDFVGAVLQVGIHGDDDVALDGVETGVEGGGFAVVAAELDATVGGIGCMEFLDDIPGAVFAAVVDHDDFIAETVFAHHFVDPFGQVRERFCLVV